MNNYRALIRKVDQQCAGMRDAYGDAIKCHKGCDACCKPFAVCRVEACNMARAVKALPRPVIAQLKQKAKTKETALKCLFLANSACRIYEHRPIICRTHGLPIMIENEGAPRVDYCPQNFTGASTLNSQNVILLSRLNQLLGAINQVFCSDQSMPAVVTQRYAMHEMLSFFSISE